MNPPILNTPVLFIIYNRPDHTYKVFEEIRKVRPKNLYIAADGPKESKTGDLNLCQQTRSIINHIDWDCSIKTKFSKWNIGCKLNVSNAISWFFENEEEGIILEDDCLPNICFFSFCSTLLNKYRYDYSVGHIGGNNFLDSTVDTDSYFFSKYPFIWGWATWRRAWKLNNLSLSTFPETLVNNKFGPYFKSNFEKYTFYNKFLQVYNDRKDTWDYQWLYTMWYNNLKSIVPPVNLVKNIGFDNRATHTKKNKKLDHLLVEPLTEIIHPQSADVNIKADQFFYNKLYRRSLLSNLILKYTLLIFKTRYYARATKKITQSISLQVSHKFLY